MIRLIEIDLAKGEKNEHPDIVADGQTKYLMKLENDSNFYAGAFCREWYGLNFIGWLGRSYQFDAPDSNSSKWQKLWRIEHDIPTIHPIHKIMKEWEE